MPLFSVFFSLRNLQSPPCINMEIVFGKLVSINLYNLRVYKLKNTFFSVICVIGVLSRAICIVFDLLCVLFTPVQCFLAAQSPR